MQPTHNQPTEVTTTPADTLRRAAAYIRQHGWHQGDMYALTHRLSNDSTPPACAYGSIQMAVCGRPLAFYDGDDSRQVTHPLRVLAGHHDRTYYLTHIGGPGSQDATSLDMVTEWNDAPGRTAEEVITTLVAAADEWDHTHRGGAR
jgi:hypothetical protein